MNCVGVRGKFRRHFFFECLESGVGVAGAEVGKDAARSRQHAPDFSSATIVFSKVGFSFCFAIASDFFFLLGDSLFEGRLEVLVLDLVERRQVVRKRAFSKKRVGGHVWIFFRWNWRRTMARAWPPDKALSGQSREGEWWRK